MREITESESIINVVEIDNIEKTIANLRQGDYLFLNLDKTVLLTGLKKYEDSPKLTEHRLAEQIKQLQESKIKVFALTARENQFADQTQEQLKALGIKFDDIIHAPSEGSTSKNEEAKKHTIGRVLKDYIVQRINNNNLPSTETVKRIIVIDELKEQLINIDSEFDKNTNDLKIPILLYHYTRPEHQALKFTSPSNKNFPKNLDAYTEVSPFDSGGTHSTFKITDPKTQHSYVLKCGASSDAIKIEILCNALYKALGVKVPAIQAYNTLPKALAKEIGLPSQYGIFQVSEFIPSDGSEEQSQSAIKAEARKHFVTHALLGNIDVSNFDNFLFNESTRSSLIDAGANFVFRATGEKRQENPDFVTEMETMRDAKFKKNHEWFKDLTEDEIIEQVKAILDKQDDLEKTVWAVADKLELSNELRVSFIQQLTNRLDHLVTRYCPERMASAKIDKPVHLHPLQSAAGIISYTQINGKPHVLLSARVKHENAEHPIWWENFGGKSDSEDLVLSNTACREEFEESSGKLNNSHLDLKGLPFHDLITEKNGEPFVYRAYLKEAKPIALDGLTDKEHIDHQWVPLSNILEAVKAAETGTDIRVKIDNEEQLILFPEFALMLTQAPVMDNLQRINTGQPPITTHTQSRPPKVQVAEIQPKEQKAKNRPMRSPNEERAGIVDTLIKHSAVMKELKARAKHKQEQEKKEKQEEQEKQEMQEEQKQAQEETLSNVEMPTGSTLSQSELHLKAVLGKDYQENNIKANVETFVGRYYANIGNTDKGKSLFEQCIQLIEHEKTNGQDNFYFYHACDNVVVFVYEVYTALHEILQASEDWPVFRASQQDFKAFDNIAQFIAFYSNEGGKDIHDHDLGYVDCGASCQVFLFGSYNSKGEGSINFLLDNQTIRKVDLEAILLKVFSQFNITAYEIKRLLDLFRDFKENSGGCLYQIGMDKKQASKMSYPSGPYGVLEPYHKNMDLVSVLNELDPGENNAYIKNLQARVLLPPKQAVTVKTLTLDNLGPQQEKEFKAKLQTITNSLLYACLQNINRFNEGIFGHSPLARTLKHVSVRNSVYATTQMSGTMLADAIIEGKTDTVIMMLDEMPSLKTVLIKPTQQHFVEEQTGVVIQAMKPLYFMLMYATKTCTAQLLSDCFGDAWFTQVSGFNMTDDKGNTLLHACARYGHSDIMDILIQNVADINAANHKGNTALHVAVKKGRIDIVKCLIQGKANLEATNDEGDTALYLAIRRNYATSSVGGKGLDMVKCLIHGRAGVINDEEGVTALYIAVNNNRLDIVKYLVEEGNTNTKAANYGEKALTIAYTRSDLGTQKCLIQGGAKIEATNDESGIALHSAVKNDHIAMTEYQARQGLSVNYKDKDGDTILFLAVEEKELEFVKYLVEKRNAKIEATNYNGGTALHAAVKNSDLKIVKYLVEERNAKIEATNKKGETALLIATSEGNFELVKYLVVDRNANVEATNDNGETVLYIAVKNKYFEIVKYLIEEKQANIEVPTYLKHVLLIAAKNGDLDTLKCLINAGVDIEAANKKGETALFIAAKQKKTKVLEYLISQKLNVNHKNKYGSPLLCWAVRESSFNTIKCLIDAGADIEATDGNSETALHLAVIGHKPELVKYLVEERKAKIEATNKKGETALLLAVSGGGFELVKYLVEERKAKIEATNKEGETALHLAVKSSYYIAAEKVQYLIQKGLAVNDKDHNANTALHMAFKLNVIKRLIQANAEVNALNREGKMPLHKLIATYKAFGYDEIEYLIQEGADTSFVTEKYKTSAKYISNNGPSGVIYLILRSNIRDKSLTPIQTINELFDEYEAFQPHNSSNVFFDGRLYLLESIRSDIKDSKITASKDEICAILNKKINTESTAARKNIVVMINKIFTTLTFEHNKQLTTHPKQQPTM